MKYTIAETRGHKILEFKVMPGHIHLFVESNRFDSPISMIKIFKDVTSLRLFKRFPELSNKCGVVFFGHHYHIMLEQQVICSKEVIKKYIQEQERQFIHWLKPVVFCRHSYKNIQNKLSEIYFNDIFMHQIKKIILAYT